MKKTFDAVDSKTNFTNMKRSITLVAGILLSSGLCFAELDLDFYEIAANNVSTSATPTEVTNTITVKGRLLSIIVDWTTPNATGDIEIVTIPIRSTMTPQTIYNELSVGADKVIRPRFATHDSTGIVANVDSVPFDLFGDQIILKVKNANTVSNNIRCSLIIEK